MAIGGLSGYRKSQESQASKFFKPKPDQKVKIRPLTELDFDARNYSEKNGLALFVKEYQHPNQYRLSFVDTMATEGACVGQELANEYGWKQPDKDEDPEGHAAWKNWRPKERVYLPVLLDDGENPESIVVLQLGMGPKQAQWNALEECHNNNGSIVDRWWVYSRKGSGQYDTTYSLSPLDRDDDLPEASQYDVPDLEQFVNRIPYADQRRYLGLDRPAAAPAQSEQSSPKVPETIGDLEW